MAEVGECEVSRAADGERLFNWHGREWLTNKTVKRATKSKSQGQIECCVCSISRPHAECSEQVARDLPVAAGALTSHPAKAPDWQLTSEQLRLDA